MTLNGLAFDYMAAHEQMPLLGYAMLVPGFVCALLIPNRGRRIARGPHWLAVLALAFALNIQQFVWFAMPAAVQSDVFWLLPGADIVTSLVVGGLLALLAKARSRDAFGHTGWAFLQLLPPFTLFLLLASSRPLPEGPAPQRLLAGWELSSGSIAACGIALIIANKGMASWQEASITQTVATAASAEPFATNLLRYQIEARGLEAVIAEVATSNTYPLAVEPGHRITAMTGQGTALHVFHEFDEPEAEELIAEYRRAVISEDCAGMGWLLDRGGSLVRHYSRTPDGMEFEVLRITNGDCLV